MKVIRIISILLLITFLAIGCGSSGGGGDDGGNDGNNNGSSDTNEVKIKGAVFPSNPGGPLISRIELETDQSNNIEAIELYRNELLPEQSFKSVLFYLAGESQPTVYEYDDLGRVHSMHTSDGSVLTLDYDEKYINMNTFFLMVIMEL